MTTKWSPEMDALLGTAPDTEIASELGLPFWTVGRRRNKLNIPTFSTWTPTIILLLGMEPDGDVANRLGISRGTVWQHRKRLGVSRETTRWRRLELEIPSWQSQQSPLKGTRYEYMRKLPNTLTLAQWKNACEYFNNCCTYCGEKCFLTEDHLMPLSRGGPRTVLNIVPACQSCNSSKNNKRPHIWIYEHFGPEEGQKIVDSIATYLTGIQECLGR